MPSLVRSHTLPRRRTAELLRAVSEMASARDVRTASCAEVAAELGLEEGFPDLRGGGGRGRAACFLARRLCFVVVGRRDTAVIILSGGPYGTGKRILRGRVVGGYDVDCIGGGIPAMTHHVDQETLN